MDGRYKNPDNDPRGPWKPVDGTISLSGGQRGAQYAKTGVSANIYELITPSGRKLLPAKGRCWYFTKEKMILPTRIKEEMKDTPYVVFLGRTK